MGTLVPANNVRERFGVTDMTLWRWLRDDALSFPRPIYIKTRRYWREDELSDWIASRAA